MDEGLRVLLEDVVREMVGLPDSVQVVAKKDLFLIQTDPADVGKIIGRKGRVITALRTVFMAIGAVEGERIVVEIKQPPRAGRPPRQGGHQRGVLG